MLKSLRFIHLNHDYYLVIKYQETIRSQFSGKNSAIFDINIIRESEIRDHELKRRRSESAESMNVDDLNFDNLDVDESKTTKAKGVGMSHTWDLVPIIPAMEFVKNGAQVFDLVKNGRCIDFSKDSLKNIYGFDKSWGSENLYLASTYNRQRISDEPLNEIHLLSTNRGSGIKLPNGYSPATEIQFEKSPTERYLLICRESKYYQTELIINHFRNQV